MALWPWHGPDSESLGCIVICMHCVGQLRVGGAAGRWLPKTTHDIVFVFVFGLVFDFVFVLSLSLSCLCLLHFHVLGGQLRVGGTGRPGGFQTPLMPLCLCWFCFRVCFCLWFCVYIHFWHWHWLALVSQLRVGGAGRWLGKTTHAIVFVLIFVFRVFAFSFVFDIDIALHWEVN